MTDTSITLQKLSKEIKELFLKKISKKNVLKPDDSEFKKEKEILLAKNKAYEENQKKSN